MKAKVVIGANYGDEGKGLVTDYLTSRFGANLVVRFNGGAQAGHTVNTPNGQRHVFSHFSSGSFKNAKTVLGPEFVMNPILFFRERDSALMLKNAIVVADPHARLTTPYDMMLNQISEKLNGSKASCGVGINETIQRSFQHAQIFGRDVLGLRYQDIVKMNDEEIYYFLQLIRREWVPFRLRQLNIDYTRDLKTMVMDDQILWTFIDQLKKFIKQVPCISTREVLRRSREQTVIFEGAQGLGLDMVNGTFPYVTHSMTGISNVLQFADMFERIDLFYVTRAYLTRHGDGPMESNLRNKPYSGIDERTNVTNDHQGSFRYGHLKLSSLKERIETDLRIINTVKSESIDLTASLVVTCLDQVDDEVKFLRKGKTLYRCPRADFAKEVAKSVGILNYYEVTGNTREHVKFGVAV